jgi:hypothetical protein
MSSWSAKASILSSILSSSSALNSKGWNSFVAFSRADEIGRFQAQ